MRIPTQKNLSSALAKLTLLSFAIVLNSFLYTNCSGQGFSTISVSSSGSATDSSATNSKIPGKYLDATFTLGTRTAFSIFNTDFTPNNSFYVDANRGNDANPGTWGLPFKTVARAQAEVRSLLATKPAAGNIAVNLSGQFWLSTPLTFTSVDSGQNGNFVIYQSVSNPQAMISGGTLLSNAWKLANPALNIYSMPVGSLRFRNLYVNGLRAQRARSSLPLSMSTTNSTGADVSSCGLPTVASDTPVEIVTLLQWEVFRCQGIWHPNQTVTASQPCWGQMLTSYAGAPSKISWLENALAFLTQKGQWFLDSTVGVLYYIPRTGEDMTLAQVIAPQQMNLIQANKLANVAFLGIEFSHTNWNEPDSPNGYVNAQAEAFAPGSWAAWVSTPSAFECVGCNNILVMDSKFDHLGTAGIHFGGGASTNLFFNNTISDTSAGGIQIGGFSAADANDPTLLSTGNSVENNMISSIGQEFFGSVGIFQGYAARSKIIGNTIHDIPYTGISVGWGWTLDASPNSHDNLILNNHIYNGTLVMQDGGGIYTLSQQMGTQISNNYIHDLGGGLPGVHNGIFSNGIYLDNGSEYMTISNNVEVRIPSLGIFIQNIAMPFALNNSTPPNSLSDSEIELSAGVRSLPRHP